MRRTVKARKQNSTRAAKVVICRRRIFQLGHVSVQAVPHIDLGTLGEGPRSRRRASSSED